MGHQIYTESFPLNCDKKKVQEHFDSIARHEDYYEGASGLPAPIRWIDDVILDNREAALKWIEENENPWYDQLAVRYREYPNFVPSVKYNKLVYKANELTTTYHEISRRLHFTDAKAEFIGCKACGSKISKKHLHANHCPVCGKDLRPESTLERLKKMRDRIDGLNDEIHEEYMVLQKKQIKHSVIKYLVKVEFHV